VLVTTKFSGIGISIKYDKPQKANSVAYDACNKDIFLAC